ncbi:MAG: EpsG family protein [Flavobacterium sp.]
MFDWVPLEYYTALFFYTTLFLVLGVWFKLNKENRLTPSSKVSIVVVWGLILYMGLRPISGVYFTDMANYANAFEKISDGYDVTLNEDIGFDFFIRTCTKIMTVQMFFLACATIYVLPLWYLSKKWFKENWFYAFLMLIGSLSFWAYGTNGIRNGMATSLFLMGLAFTDRKVVMIVFLVLACSVHKSMLLPSVAYGLTLINNDPKKYFLFWLLAIPLSLALGSFWENYFAGLGFGDDRMSYLTEGNINDDDFSNTGFRWDFLIYSATGVFTGYYFIIKKGFQDKIYNHLLNIYLIVNAFWILIIRANFSNRFAYLSWFMLGLVIIYPFLKQKRVTPKLMSKIIVIYIFFSYLMNVILVK